ncbi:M23 family metallopeptidase [Microbacterium sp. C7(2022)]|uniref:M23 family metallopeptidase n=1 Tax=Microbacterium sp. C7(2022) TaxID=2992759 RepID=UPI00237B4371|nr:M23 family metallopeptidase [Microbacterium sp. C7(2022)]MDE0547103.1 M23 family metallopeptidase [Microbacterium sp. C7(2022)]
MPTSQRSGAEAPEDDLAEHNDSPSSENENEAALTTRRANSRRKVATNSKVKSPAVASARPAAHPATPRPTVKSRVAKPLRSLVVLSMVGGLVATVALPAFATGGTVEAEPVTVQQMASEDAQSLVVASDVSGDDLARDSYSATTEEEIEEEKAKEAAAAAAAARARMTASVASVPVNVNMVSPGSGAVRWPITSFTKGRGLWDSGYHQGVDLLGSCGTPLYAAASGVVRVSQESFGGYGVAVTIDHVLNGQQVSTLYGHMTYGSRQVSSGQSVSAGQLIGLVGSTGSSTACHLHFEVHINGGVVDPWAWLQANAG